MATLVPTGDETLNFEPEETNRGMPTHLDLAIRGGEDELLDDPVRDQAQRSPGTDRRLTPTLLRVFARRRKQIGVSLDQVARLSGISTAELVRYEDEAVPTSITYDQVVVLARVLGVSLEDLPGLRPREERFPLGLTLAELERALFGAPLLRFEGASGERFGGDVERAAASKAFTVRIDDDSLAPAMFRGALLGFMNGTRVRPGSVVLLRHRRSSLMAMRRLDATLYRGILPWQPSYPIGGEWLVSGSLEVTLPPR